MKNNPVNEGYFSKIPLVDMFRGINYSKLKGDFEILKKSLAGYSLNFA